MKTSLLSNLDPQLAKAKSLASWDDLAHELLVDVQQGVAHALANPVGFPSLETAIIPDDKVCLAMEADLPRAAEVMEAIVEYLLAHGTLARNITILIAGQTGVAGPLSAEFAKNSSILRQVEVHTHDPAARIGLGYLAANEAGEPIYINRQLIDADVVIPISVAKGAEEDWRSQVEFLFPAFSDEATLSRFRQMAVENSAADERMSKEAEEAIRWLGVYLSVQVEPGPGRSVLRITAGERKTALQQGRQGTRQAWHRQLSSSCQLIVAGLSDRGWKYSWWELLAIAERYCQVLDKAGSLVIHARLEAPARGGRSARSSNMSRHEQARLEDLLANFHIYLFTDLKRETVESLGFGFVESNEEIDRLARQAERCLVVADAAYSSVSLQE